MAKKIPGSARNYQRGRAKEYRMISKLKKEGYDIAQRSAGSHSPIDVFAINKKEQKIKFIQLKPKSMSDNMKTKLEKEHDWLNDEYVCSFEVM